MNDLTHIPDDLVFEDRASKTLAAALAACNRSLTGTALRDMQSAFRFLETRMAIDLDCVLARPRSVRAVFKDRTATELGVSEKRLANVRALVGQAVAMPGMRPRPITRVIDLAPEWLALLQSIDTREHRWGLSRFAAYCSIKGLSPNDVTSNTLLGFERALDREDVSKDPRNIRKHTIALWNMCGKRVPGWPAVRLASPTAPEVFAMPLGTFPEPFQRDVADWEALMSSADPFDPKAPTRPLRHDTQKGYRVVFRRLATALVRSGEVRIEEVTGLSALLASEANFKAALRPFVKSDVPSGNGYAHKMATMLLTVGRRHLGMTDEALAPFRAIAARLKPTQPGGMGKRNRTRLAQFDDAAAVQALLHYPANELDRAWRIANPVRRAKVVERAFAVSLMLATALRAKTFRELRLDRNIRRAGQRVFIDLAEDQTKTHTRHSVELAEDTVALLDLYLAQHRPLLSG
ncbi:MAG: hypothetical protein AAFX00_13820, partial [Pseudomonadota bacterium]